MSLEVEAIYENGVLKPSQPLPLQEGQKVTVRIQQVGSAAKRFSGSLRWTRDPDELRQSVNNQSVNNPDESSWSSRDV
jgi:predicted DNA-binding antitoxin AbrB/MazE fold protein